VAVSGSTLVHVPNPVERRDPDTGAQPKLVVGIDLGGTKILAGIGNRDGEVLKTLEEPTRHGEGAPVLDQLVSLVRRLLAEAGSHDLDNVVIGVPSAVDPQTGLASLSPNLALPQDVPLADLLGDRLGCKVTVENDVNLAAYAEALAGAGRGERSLAFLSYGTGVGLGLVVNGEMWRGAFGRAGEIGFLPIGSRPHERAPHSENGLYEDEVGSRGIRERFLDAGGSVTDLFVSARDGDPRASAALDEIARAASLGLAAIHTMFDPALTVVAGGIGSQGEFLVRLKSHLVPLLPFDCRIEASVFGTKAGMVGAVMLAARHAVEAAAQPASGTN
jgi:predicted NBD/HSP70 family sugar kinase